MIAAAYRAQVDLLLQVLPYVSKEEIFALKGGTAINLFIREMPRLSVDLDLTYLPLDSRTNALQNIQDGLGRIKTALEKNLPGVRVNTVPLNDGTDVKLYCQGKGAQIKIEVNTITRGNVFPTQLMQVADSVQDEFDKFAAAKVVSMAELYGGKICAAIDRQHPRDLFDVKLLLENEGFTKEIWEGVKIGLISHYKPISELLSPVLKDQKSAFDNQFAGMTAVEFSYYDYETTRALLIQTIGKHLTNKDKRFLLSFESGEPDWKLFPIPGLKDLPAIQWKLINIARLKKNNPQKHEQMVKNLKDVIGYSQ
ncbi:nucleotidyl transferase AbiEii/AbiGii toxin family protein [Marinilabilia salmonicolor]|uniref:Nucleotidyltransferase AbiEii toxin of type IV toxin-antitoxin system n=1 Tax=Marinilabilia salmonicolor TaxID=989 RepID=A0A368UKQ9_9BACT|nr:nucleotidyl transferase AbiEii/AbiGii toxin family protein [Marinilabilia salmonicolor]RCW24656.1 nucleotidyltransferase AbiEii toxin of type IV toxin-antitoxin system [Marinilabilia salmonicolor]